MRPISTLILAGLMTAFVSNAAIAQKGKKLYRWTDEHGQVRYTDQLPPQAAQAARDELNSQGMAVGSVRRAMTAEERAAFDAEQARAAEQARLDEERSKMDAVLLGSYPTEKDLERAYKERFELIERSVESAQVGISSQEKSLASLLEHAAALEREGRVVPVTVLQSIGKTREQVGEQRKFLGKREAERAALHSEYDSTLTRYRELAAARAEKQATASASTN